MKFHNLTLSVNFQYFIIYLLAAFYLYLVSLQGFDLCDEGWVLSAFQQIFIAPESVAYNFLYYLNVLIGGIFYHFIDNSGIFAFRLLNASLILITFFVMQKIFKSFLTPKIFAITVLFSFLITDFGAIVLDHNYLTSLLNITAVYYIFTSNHKVLDYKIIIAGFLVGLSFFARLPNLTMMILVVLFFIDYHYFRNFNLLIKKMACFFGGIFIAILFMFFVIQLLNHDEIFINNVYENVLHGATDPNHNHSLSSMFKTYMHQGFGMIKFALITFFIIGVFASINHYLKNKLLLILSYFLIFAIVVYFGLVDDLLNFSTLLLIPLFYSFYKDYKNREMMILNTSALLIFIFLPWGSDGGAYNLGITCLFLLVLLSTYHFVKSLKDENFAKHKPVLIMFSVFLLSFVPLRTYRIYHTAYFDFGPRHEKIFSINHPLADTYTTQVKSKIMNDLLLVLSKEIKPNEVVYMHESLPMLHFLTYTQPYLDNSWPWIYGPENFNKRLIIKEKQSDFRPTIVRQKCQPIGGKWTNFDKKYNDTISSLNFSYNPYRTKYFEDFLKRNHYQVTWENELFQILKCKN